MIQIPLEVQTHLFLLSIPVMCTRLCVPGCAWALRYYLSAGVFSGAMSPLSHRQLFGVLQDAFSSAGYWLSFC